MVVALVILGIVALLALATVAMLLRQRTSTADSQRLELRLDVLSTKVGEVIGASQAGQQALQAGQKALGDVREALGSLTQAAQRMTEVGQEIKKLQDVLAVPRLRGGLGELLLENLLSQYLPQDGYQLQYTLRNGQRVDAIIRFPTGLVPVDAKFPLESFERLVVLQSEEERRPLLRQFRDAVRRHVDSIAQGYICPGETMDFALMYIPAENIYYEVIIKHETQDDLLDYCWGRRVIPCSPNSFYAYLQLVALGLAGLKMEQNARIMLDSLKRLRGDFEKFAEDYRLVGEHLRRAKDKYEEGSRKLEGLHQALPEPTRVPQPQPLEGSESPIAEPPAVSAWTYPERRKRGRPRKHPELPSPSEEGVNTS